MDKQMKRIVLTKEQRIAIRDVFGVSDKTVSLALNYRSDGALYQKIRALALQKGGVVTGQGGYQMETIHDSHGKMIQTWGGRVVLEADKTTGTVRVIIDGEEKEVHEHVSVSQLMKMQQRMAIWAAKL